MNFELSSAAGFPGDHHCPQISVFPIEPLLYNDWHYSSGARHFSLRTSLPTKCKVWTKWACPSCPWWNDRCGCFISLKTVSEFWPCPKLFPLYTKLRDLTLFYLSLLYITIMTSFFVTFLYFAMLSSLHFYSYLNLHYFWPSFYST